MGVRLVSIADDSLQHIGQAAYVRGFAGGLSDPLSLPQLPQRLEQAGRRPIDSTRSHGVAVVSSSSRRMGRHGAT